VISHGWNNNEQDATQLYEKLLQNLAAVAPALPGRSAVIGVIWPSKKFDETVAVAQANVGAGGAASLTTSAQSLQAVAKKLDTMKTFFTTAAEQKTLEEAKALLPDLEDKVTAQTAFIEKLRSLLDSSAANREDASTIFFKEQPKELMNRLKINPANLSPGLAALPNKGAAMALTPGAAGGKATAGGAAGFKDIFSGISAAAMNVLNFTTYFEMKARAGLVGGNGVAPLIDQLAPKATRIHLIGHSFGGRVMASAALRSTTNKIASMSLLQAAFSHNGFSKSENGAFRAVVDSQRVNGPIIITHTRNDNAVGVAYPLASRIAGDAAAAFGDENDKFGGLGRNGAQKMEMGETILGTLLKSDGNYTFEAHKLHNLEGSAFIPDHSGITGKEVANAIRCAVGA
jgi:hypothetical protein